MKTLLQCRFILCCIFLSISTQGFALTQETLIPQTVYNSIYKYYMLEVTKNGTTFLATYKVVAPSNFTFLRSEINCNTRSIRDIGSSTRSIKDISSTPSAWVHPRIGTIHFDLVTFVCK